MVEPYYYHYVQLSLGCNSKNLWQRPNPEHEHFNISFNTGDGIVRFEATGSSLESDFLVFTAPLEALTPAINRSPWPSFADHNLLSRGPSEREACKATLKHRH